MVDDLDAAVFWYGYGLGFVPEQRFGLLNVGGEAAHLDHPGGIRVEVIQWDGLVESPDCGLDALGMLQTRGAKHVGSLVGDLNAAARELRAKGVEVVRDVTVVGPAGMPDFLVRTAPATWSSLTSGWPEQAHLPLPLPPSDIRNVATGPVITPVMTSIFAPTSETCRQCLWPDQPQRCLALVCGTHLGQRTQGRANKPDT